WTIGIMGVATGLIGLLPPFAVAGWVGAILLVTLRLVQGLSLGGEWGGAVLLATEHATPKRHAFAAAFPQLGSPIGSILAAALFLLMTATVSPEAMVEWGWRIPFLTAIPLLLVSLYLRWSIDETPVFKAAAAAAALPRVPLAQVFAQAPVAFVI